MGPDAITLIVMVVILVIFIILGIAFLIIKAEHPPVTNPAAFYLAQYQNVGLWGGNVVSGDPVRSTCNLYQFEGGLQMLDLGSGPQLVAVPASPSLNPDILNALTPEPLAACYDLDNLSAAQVTHTCITSQDVAAADFTGTTATGQTGISFCYNAEGMRVAIGGGETYYTQTTSLFDAAGNPIGKLSCDNTQCAGILSLLAFNYIPGGPQTIYQQALCLSTDVAGDSFTGVSCDLGVQDQLIRITRAGAPAPGSSTVQPTDGRVGVLANLFFRLAGKFVVANTDLTGLTLSTDGTMNWALVPQLNGTKLTGPQQLVWVGGLTSAQLSQFNAVLSYDQLLALIQSTGLVSVQLQSLSSPNLILAPYSTYTTGTSPTPANHLATFMYVNYNLFGQILLTTAATAF